MDRLPTLARRARQTRCISKASARGDAYETRAAWVNEADLGKGKGIGVFVVVLPREGRGRVYGWSLTHRH